MQLNKTDQIYNFTEHEEIFQNLNLLFYMYQMTKTDQNQSGASSSVYNWLMLIIMALANPYGQNKLAKMALLQ